MKHKEAKEYSSYPLYISSSKDNIVTKKLILELVRRNNGNERGAYQLFVETAIGRELDDQTKDVKRKEGSALDIGHSLLNSLNFSPDSPVFR